LTPPQRNRPGGGAVATILAMTIVTDNKVQKNSESLSEALRKQRAKQALPEWLSDLRRIFSTDFRNEDF
jgi:hypothetical protein